MCFVLGINKQNQNKISNQGSQLFLLPCEHIPKESEKQSPNLCSRSLFFLTSLPHLHFLLHFLGFHPLGPCKTKLLPQGLCCASAAVCSGHREEEEGHGVCRRCVFPASHKPRLSWGSVTSHKGERAPERGQVVSLGMEMVCNAVLVRRKRGQQEKFCSLAWNRAIVLRSGLLVIKLHLCV